MENKLISMVAFIQRQEETRMQSNPYNEQDYDNYFIRIVNEYAKFLKQPLTLGMFIPVDENNVPLEFIEYESWTVSDEEYNEYTHKYFEAKERVLFENAVRIDRSPYKCTGRLLIDLAIDTPFRILTELRYPDGKIERTEFPSPKKPNMTIEDLVSYNLTLTATAIKNIYES
ncbi:hypothetical protein [Elizabethkingia miricola]|uniref:hypothetical protein n=1 Tax=Elizabethkingia miricola TaxID=172045 RepID=UPI0009991A41|nr:hypothetical protein [Elizabethkingia miricola]OPC34584.1 hypothetical protein BAX99_06875 [Elizabethkingia miricola]